MGKAAGGWGREGPGLGGAEVTGWAMRTEGVL